MPTVELCRPAFWVGTSEVLAETVFQKYVWTNHKKLKQYGLPTGKEIIV